jgi:hypothetical protein
MALKVAGWLVEIQTGEGAWVRPGAFRSLKEQPLPVSLDTTLERGFFLHEIAGAIGGVSEGKTG